MTGELGRRMTAAEGDAASVTARVVKLLDAAGDAAWECRGRERAIGAAWAVLGEAGSEEEAAAAIEAWCRAVGFCGRAADLRPELRDRYSSRDDIALSLKRAAFMTEQAAAGQAAGSQEGAR